ncbi:hypothetical protein C0995_005054 [Termitomyces sp. Mi166|nr:hypothetical protein C0995_005054 [Termitomyces sp. Mi166\
MGSALHTYGNLGVPKSFASDWTPMTSWSSSPSTRNASVSSAASGTELDTGFCVSYSSMSRSASGNWDDATDPQAQKVRINALAVDANALHHARALDRQAPVTQEDLSVAPKSGQYSPQRFDTGLGKDQGPRFPSVSSPTRPTLPVPGYSSSQSPNTSSSVGTYSNLQISSSVNDDLSLSLRDMSIEDEYSNHQTLSAPQLSPSLHPLPRSYGYVPPPDYNTHHGQDFQYGYGHPDPVYGSPPTMNASMRSALYVNPGMPTPQMNPSGVPVPDIYRQQLFYYDTPQLPPQYYLPLSQNVMYSQLHPPLLSSHSHMMASQLPTTVQDKKRDLQYAPNMHQARTNFLYNPIRSSMSPHQQLYPNYTQYFMPPGLVPLLPPNLQKNVRGRQWPGQHNTDTAALRSPLLEEFRANKIRKWELKDIFGHAVEFSGDQHGSRFIQQKLETATSEEKQTIFDEIVPTNAFPLMVDVFGNYVIQKLFEHGTQVQKICLAQTMEGSIHGLSQQMYGCRVVQKAIEFVLPEQQAAFVRELEPHILRCVKDPNGNHVIQKLVERVSPDNLGFIQKFRGNVYDLATHPYGCRVLQRCLEHLPEETTRPLMDELHKYATSLMQDQFGNYVMQYILEHGRPHDRTQAISKLQGQILTLARHKFASNVCEKALVCANPETRRRLIDEILVTQPDGVLPITGMMRDQYANYVLQRAMTIAAGDQKEMLFNKVMLQVQSMRRHSGAYSKHLMATEHSPSYLTLPDVSLVVVDDKNHIYLHQMNGVEAAASLFGSEEPGSDPFASLGVEAAPVSSDGNNSLFNAASNNVDFFNAPQDSPPAVSGNDVPDTSQYYTQTQAAASAYPTDNSYTPFNADNASQDGWHGQQGQGHTYTPQQNYPTPAHDIYAPAVQPQQSQPAPASGPYDPYVPTTSTYNPPAPTTTHSYDPYVPAQPANSYALPQPAVPALSAYSPYASPSAASQVYNSQYTSSYPSGSQTALATEHPLPPKPTSVPVPSAAPAAKTTITRPKISNAYDPPFPTTTKSRKTARAVSAQNTYGYNAYETLSPPVPAYGLPSSQTAPYLTQQTPPPPASLPPPQRLPPPPLPQATTPPPQRLPPPPPLPQIALAIPQHCPTPPPSHTPPSTRSPALPLQPQYNSNRTPGVQSMPLEGFADADNLTRSSGYTQPLPDPEDPETMGQNDSSWDQNSSGVNLAPSVDGVQEVAKVVSPPQNADPEPFDSSATNGLNNASIPLSDEPVLVSQPPPTSLVDETNHYSSAPGHSISLETSLRSDSPRHYALPPSPTVNHQQGRSSPFAEPNLRWSKRTASPASFVDPSKEEKIQDPYAPPQNPPHNPTSHSPVQTYDSQLRSSPTATHYGNGVRSPSFGATNPYLPKAIGGERVTSSTNSLDGHTTGATDSYAPKTHTGVYKEKRTNSPNSSAVRVVNGAPHVAKTYLANSYVPAKPELRDRSMSNSSMLSSASTSVEDPYAPPPQGRRSTSDAVQRNFSSKYNYPTTQEANYHPFKPPDNTIVQELSIKTFQTPYAPSPSLLGANDPLGRTSAHVPVFSFGFGGKVVTCFHGADSLSTGFDVALAARNSTGVQIRVLKKLIPESALDTSTASFPGPLFGDSGISATSLVRTGVSSQTKAKKGKVTKYLTERTDELALGLRYLKPGSLESHQVEGKLVLVKLLQLMVEHDGRLTGTPELDTAVRLALVPRLEGTFGSSGFVSVADTPLPGSSTEPQETPISITSVRPSTLSKIQDFLLRGERKQAYRLALDEKLWGHAMVIASSIDKEAWKEVVQEFLRTELANDSSALPERGSLRVAYSLFSGQGAAAGMLYIPSRNLLARAAGRSVAPVAPHLTPRTPNFPAVPAQGSSFPPQALARWTETAAMMLSNPLTSENSAALTALGDQLAANHFVEAAHVCYLLAPQTSPLGGLGHPSARMTLVGSRSPQTWPNFAKDPDSIIFSEIVEFAMSLTTSAKGQEPFSGIAHLQAYRFIRAISLAEIGDIQQAHKYCDAITAAIGRGSPYATSIFLEQLKGLSDRISGVAHVDKSFWTGAKLSKPSLDSIGGWLEGRFTKLVTGDADLDSTPEEDVNKPDEGGFVGPFSHYSTISSTTSSARSSPQPSVTNPNVLPPARSGSAMAHSAPHANTRMDRASSAMDYTRPKPTPPAPRVASANASTTSFTSFGQAPGGQRSFNGYSSGDDLVTSRPSLVPEEDEGTVQEAAWWAGTAYAEGPSTATPTTSTFLRVDEGAIPASQSSDGFISLMDNASYSIASQTSLSQTSIQTSSNADEGEEDLGFGNYSIKVQREAKREPSNDGSETTSSAASPEPGKVAPPPVEENKPLPTPGWFSRWWRKSDAPGPIKASLGEESTFYYDNELKRWVNKQAGDAKTVKAATPAPPPRAQTASPAMTGPRPPGPPESRPPANRSTSATDIGASPPNRTTRVRSNLVPTPESAPSTPTGTRLAPSGPPPGRPKSQASKRNIRSRYVDVFQQDNAT